MVRAAVLRRHLSDDQRAAMAALWKQENSKQAGRPIREESQENSARRRAEFCGDARHPTRAEATERFNVSRWRVD